LPHRTERDGKKPDASPSQFQITFSKMNIARATAIVAKATPAGWEEQRRIDAGVGCRRVFDESQQIVIAVGNNRPGAPSTQNAYASWTLWRAGQIDAYKFISGGRRLFRSPSR
jgi:hypothetical protein